MDSQLFIDILNIDSTSGRERALADFLAERFVTDCNRVERIDVGDGTVNLLFSWGEPKVVFCSHLDTVPPYIPPVRTGVVSDGSSLGTVGSAGRSADNAGGTVMSCGADLIGTSALYGRGTCDAKGQFFSMWEACKALEARGCDDFGLLLLAGEEVGSFGAKALNSLLEKAKADGAAGLFPKDAWLIVGEPTDNCMASASKGTKSFEVTFSGRAFHSGYPQYGQSAVLMFNDFVNALRSIGFPDDEILGETTWNIGKLVSDNPQNILSDSLTCRVYFRTTFASDEMVCNVMRNMAGVNARLRFGKRCVQDGSDIVGKEVAPWQKAMSVKEFGGDTPTSYDVLPGFETKPVAFGSDAPQLKTFPHKILCGPGSILVAHRPEEHILFADIEKATANYLRMYEIISGQKQHDSIENK